MKANQKVRNGKKMTKKLDDMPFVMINLDKPRKIRFTSWSVVEMESRYKRKLGPMYKDVQEGNVGLVDNMILLRAGLLEEMPGLENCPTPPEGNIMLDASLEYFTRLYDADCESASPPRTHKYSSPPPNASRGVRWLCSAWDSRCNPDTVLTASEYSCRPSGMSLRD